MYIDFLQKSKENPGLICPFNIQTGSREQGDKRKHWQRYSSDTERGKGKS